MHWLTGHKKSSVGVDLQDSTEAEGGDAEDAEATFEDSALAVRVLAFEKKRKNEK